MSCRLPIVVLALTMFGSALAADGEPAARCTRAKLRIAASAVRSLVRCHGRAIDKGGAVDPACVAAAEHALAKAWGKLEARKRCPPAGDLDAVRADVEAFVAELVAELTRSATSTTVTTATTTTSSCPPPTALYCGASGCAPLPALCPTGTECTTANEGCACVGEVIPCGDSRLSGLSGAFCRWGECPPGTTCTSIPTVEGCGFDCGCR